MRTQKNKERGETVNCILSLRDPAGTHPIHHHLWMRVSGLSLGGEQEKRPGWPGGRRNNRSCSNQDGSSNSNAVELVTLGTMGKKKQEVSDPENPTLNHRRRIPRLKESQSSASSQEARISSRKCGKSKGKSCHRDRQPAPFLRHTKDSFAEAGSGSDARAVPDNGAPAGAVPTVPHAVQKPPVLYDDWSDDLEVCRLVPNKKDLAFLKGVSPCHSLSAFPLTAFCHYFSVINC